MRCLGLDHVGLTVPNLDQAVRFFVDALGAEESYRYERQPDGDFMESDLGGDRDGCFRLSMLSVPPDLSIELFEWRVGDHRRSPALHSDPGGRHLALRVADIHAALAQITDSTGAVQLGQVKRNDKNSALEGLRWVYVRTDFGLLIELIERPVVDSQTAPVQVIS